MSQTDPRLADAHDPARRTWRSASYQPPTERRAPEDRRADVARGAVGDRRRSARRSLRSLLRL